MAKRGTQLRSVGPIEPVEKVVMYMKNVGLLRDSQGKETTKRISKITKGKESSR